MKNSINIIIVGIALMFALSSEAAAVTRDGNDLLEFCQATERYIDAGESETEIGASIGLCIGVVEATSYTLGLLSMKFPEGSKYKACIPGDVTTKQLIRIALKYLRGNPDELHLPAFSLVMAATINAFPCE